MVAAAYDMVGTCTDIARLKRLKRLELQKPRGRYGRKGGTGDCYAMWITFASLGEERDDGV
jgi:hypothetical protein